MNSFLEDIMAKNTNYLFKLDLLLLSILKEKDKYGYEMMEPCILLFISL